MLKRKTMEELQKLVLDQEAEYKWRRNVKKPFKPFKTKGSLNNESLTPEEKQDMVDLEISVNKVLMEKQKEIVALKNKWEKIDQERQNALDQYYNSLKSLIDKENIPAAIDKINNIDLTFHSDNRRLYGYLENLKAKIECQETERTSLDKALLTAVESALGEFYRYLEVQELHRKAKFQKFYAEFKASNSTALIPSGLFSASSDSESSEIDEAPTSSSSSVSQSKDEAPTSSSSSLRQSKVG